MSVCAGNSYLNVSQGSPALWCTSTATTNAAWPATATKYRKCEESDRRIVSERWCWKEYCRWFVTHTGRRHRHCLHVSVNLALSFARHGYRAGILDTDIFGPSIPTLLNLSGEPRLSASQSISRSYSIIPI